MQQRRLRLGDTVDDYCPRERRLTNHLVAAMVDDQVTHTRCTTCDADHDYKQARVPTLRRKRLDGDPAADSALVPGRVVPPQAEDVSGDEVSTEAAGNNVTVDVAVSVEAVTIEAAAEDEPVRREDDGPVHRRLIRATFPRPEGQPPEWKEPEFTIRQPSSPSRGRFGRGGGQGEPNGNRGGQARRHDGGGGFQGRPGGGPPRDGNRPAGGGRPGGQGGGQGPGGQGQGHAPVGPGGQRRRRRGR
ncbi:MAG: hypothetical protein Q7J25_03485 [Vicinamibacterales bacterium]|nr:hypothetical protein [Vicinamibacterales bacterium]